MAGGNFPRESQSPPSHLMFRPSEGNPTPSKPVPIVNAAGSFQQTHQAAGSLGSANQTNPKYLLLPNLLLTNTGTSPTGVKGSPQSPAGSSNGLIFHHSTLSSTGQMSNNVFRPHSMPDNPSRIYQAASNSNAGLILNTLTAAQLAALNSQHGFTVSNDRGNGVEMLGDDEPEILDEIEPTINFDGSNSSVQAARGVPILQNQNQRGQLSHRHFMSVASSAASSPQPQFSSSLPANAQISATASELSPTGASGSSVLSHTTDLSRLKKDNHNRIERRRRDHINEKIAELQNLLQLKESEQKVHKGLILEKTCEYIKSTQNLQNINKALSQELNRCETINKQLLARIRELENVCASNNISIGASLTDRSPCLASPTAGQISLAAAQTEQSPDERLREHVYTTQLRDELMNTAGGSSLTNGGTPSDRSVHVFKREYSFSPPHMMQSGPVSAAAAAAAGRFTADSYFHRPVASPDNDSLDEKMDFNSGLDDDDTLSFM